MTTFEAALEKGWLRRVGRECTALMAAYRKVEAMTIEELEDFVAAPPVAKLEHPNG